MATSIFVNPSAGGGGGSGDASYPIDLGSPSQVTGVTPIVNGGTGSADTLDFESWPHISGTLPVSNGGTQLLGLTEPGGVLTAGNSIAFRNPGIGNGTGYSIAITGAQGTATGLPFGAGANASFAFWYTPLHQGGDGYGAVLTVDHAHDNLGLYVQDADATHVHLDWFDNTDHLNTTPLVVGTRYFVTVTIDTGGNGKFYINGVLDGTFTTALQSTIVLYFANNFNEVLRASFLSNLAYFPTVLSAVMSLALYTSGNSGATAPATYDALVVTDGATHYWKLDEAGPIAFDASGVQQTFADSIGSDDIALVDQVLLVTAPLAGLSLISQAVNTAAAFGRPTKFITAAPDATSITPVLTGLAADDITYQANTQTAGTLTINNWATGVPHDGQPWLLKLKCTNVQTLAFGNGYVGGTVALPTATTGGGKIDYFAFLYDAVNGKMDFVGLSVGF